LLTFHDKVANWVMISEPKPSKTIFTAIILIVVRDQTAS
jgi:hypothetical protein